MKEQLRAGRGFIHDNAFVCVTIDVQDTVGISLADRDRVRFTVTVSLTGRVVIS
jgi:hypothetical protein